MRLPCPPAPDGLTIEFQQPEWAFRTVLGGVRFQTDTRAPVGNQPKVWDFVVYRSAEATGAEPAQVSTPDLTQLPNDLTATLIDLDGGHRQYLRTTRAYSFRLDGPERRRFQLVVEPRSTGALRLNNVLVTPTRGGLAVRYTVNKPATVQAQIRNAAGRVLDTMQTGCAASSGRNTLTWRARADAVLPRGVYVLEVTARTDEGQVARAIRSVVVR